MNKPTFLFDLDGTLADTALDLGQAINHVRQSQQLHPLPLESYRPYASQGARGLLLFGLGLTPEDEEFEPARTAFLDFYKHHYCVYTSLFKDVAIMLNRLKHHQTKWGIVTNKAFAYAKPLVRDLGLTPDVLVGGDSTPFQKPSPEPLWLACDQLGVSPQQCWYVGDDERDVVAGKAAGMKTVSIGFGYLAHGANPLLWQANTHCASVADLIELIDRELS
jgi:2-phosphoglycolate phosphatase